MAEYFDIDTEVIEQLRLTPAVSIEFGPDGHPIIKRYESEISTMSTAAAAGRNLGWETSQHTPNARAGAVIQSGVLAEMVQRIVLNDEEPRTVLGNTARKIEDIMEG